MQIYFYLGTRWTGIMRRDASPNDEHSGRDSCSVRKRANSGDFFVHFFLEREYRGAWISILWDFRGPDI